MLNRERLLLLKRTQIWFSAFTFGGSQLPVTNTLFWLLQATLLMSTFPHTNVQRHRDTHISPFDSGVRVKLTFASSLLSVKCLAQMPH